MLEIADVFVRNVLALFLSQQSLKGFAFWRFGILPLYNTQHFSLLPVFNSGENENKKRTFTSQVSLSFWHNSARSTIFPLALQDGRLRTLLCVVILSDATCNLKGILSGAITAGDSCERKTINAVL